MNNEPETRQLRTFGLMVGAVFAVIGLWPAFLRGESPRVWALILGGLLMIPAFVRPGSLGLAYRGWMALGHALGWVNTKVILSLIFYGLLTPMGLVMRWLGKDAMRRNFEGHTDTYRILRQPRPNSHMTRQF